MALNDEETAYIQEKETVVIALLRDYHPFYCEDMSDPAHNGITSDILAEITEFCGLKFTYLFADSYAEALEMVRQGDADMLGFFFGSEADAVEKGLAITKPYVTMTDLVASNKLVSYPSDGLTAAVVEGRKLPSDIKVKEVKCYPDEFQALLAVNSGEADFIYGLSTRIELELQQHYLTNIVPVSLYNKSSTDVGFAMPKPANPSLLTIFNKSLTYLTEKERASIASQNMISMGNTSLTLWDIIYANPILFVSIVVAVLLLILSAVAIAARSKVKGAVMRSELEKAEADSKTKSEFLSRMSHEIRTPMNAIVGLTELANIQEDLPEPLRNILVKLRSSSQYLLSLLNDILDMSRIDNGMLNIVKEPFSLRKMLDDFQSMMWAEAERYGINLQINTDLIHTDLTGDSIRLQQVLTNLLSNALKFTPSGGDVKLQIKETGADESGAKFEFHVIDSGIGISAKDQGRIFEAFEQAGLSKSKIQGTGLGLPISKRLVQLMGGELQLSSEEGKGSDFFFSLAFPYGEAIKELQQPALGKKALLGLRILLAEDNEINAEIAVGLLEEQGAEIICAKDGKEAVQTFSDSAPGEFQAILMDIQMPLLDGLEATRAIRALNRTDAAQIPIVAMTANTFQEDRNAAKAAGMNGFIAKPLDKEYLYVKLVELTGKQKPG